MKVFWQCFKIAAGLIGLFASIIFVFFVGVICARFLADISLFLSVPFGFIYSIFMLACLLRLVIFVDEKYI